MFIAKVGESSGEVPGLQSVAIAKAGGGIASTVKRTALASDDELLEESRRRLHALMRGGCTTVEIKSGYGLDPKSELRLLKIASKLGEGEAVRVVPSLLALHALPADQRDRRAHYVGEIVDKLIPAAAKQGLATSVDAFCETIAFTPDEVGMAIDEPGSDPGAAKRIDALGAISGKLGPLPNSNDLAVGNSDRAIVNEAERIVRADGLEGRNPAVDE
jgi:imidazolonepropionase